MFSSVAPTSAPDALSLLTDWRPGYLMLVLAVLASVGYLRTRLRVKAGGLAWPGHRDALFWIGIAALVWTTDGFPEARSDQLMWVWMMQQLLLLLIVPIIVMSAQPLTLLEAVHGSDNLLARALRTPVLKFLGSPLVGPVLVPILCLVLVFGGLGEFAVSSLWAGGLVQLLLLTVGVLIALPLVSTNDQRSSLAVGLSLAVGFLELLVDAFPGIVLRFHSEMTIAHFAVDRPTFSPVPLDDQHTAGSILWVVAELLDLPFLILAASRWIKADARDAAVIDAELDAQFEARRTSRAAAGAPEGDAPAPPDRPWWLDDPNLQDRFRG